LPAVTGFKRLALAVAAIILIVFGAQAVVSFLIPAESVREAVKAQIRAVTGLDPMLRGATSVSLFPTGHASFSDIVLGDDKSGEPPLTAERLTATLRFFPLLAGRIEIADVALSNPRIAVTVDKNGRSNWLPLVQSLARNMRPDASRAERAMSFSEIRIERGTILVRDEASGVQERLDDAEISLAWPSISKSFAATGQLRWRGEPLDASISLGDFAAALLGEKSGLKIRVSGQPAKFAFEGSVGTHPTLKIEGNVAADAPSLRRAFVWGGVKPLPGGGFGRFALKAQTNVVGGTIALSSVNIELDGNSAEGVLTFATDGRQTLQGTLAADALDFSPYVSTVRLLTTNEREWSKMPLLLDGLTGVDLDLRLSAARLTISDAKLGRTAIAANLRGGKLVITVGESQAFGGVIKGSFGLAKSAQGAELKSQLQFANVDLDACISALFGIKRLEGKGDLAFGVEAAGETVLALTRSMNGSATLTGQKGALTGLNVEQLLRRLERRPLSGGSEIRTGRTPYERLTIMLKIAQGTATVEDVSLQGSSVRLALAGSASIPQRDLDLKGTASLVPAAGESQPGFELPFVVQGPWDDPIVLPDAQILIRRSGAAAPLLDAVKDKRTRDAVRSAIERMTGGRLAAPSTEAAAPAAAPAATAAPAPAADADKPQSQ
jgi:AsmA protein